MEIINVKDEMKNKVEELCLENMNLHAKQIADTVLAETRDKYCGKIQVISNL